MVQTKTEELRQVITETTGAALTLSPNEEGWGGYLFQRKKKFEAKTLDELCTIIIAEIISKRERVVVTEGKKVKKPYKY